MAAYNKFNQFVGDLAHGYHALTTSAIMKVMLSNTLPTSSMTTSTDITQIAANNGYVTGGSTSQVTSSTQTSGTFKLIGANVVFTASSTTSTAGIGPFEYVIYYNSSTANTTGPLISWYDYGSAVTLNPTETFTVSFDPSSGIFQIT